MSSNSSLQRLLASCTYSPLSTSAFEIRLLTVNPPTNSRGLVSVYMAEYRLAVAPMYATISYTWGRPSAELPHEWDDETVTLPILLNGSEFRVRPNLHSLLQRLASDDQLKGIAYWIDALCINQNNLEEKNVVVPRMTEIYAGGRRNWVWLGPHAADGSTQLAFAKMSSVGKSWEQRSKKLQDLLVWDDQLDAYADFVRSEFPEDEGTRYWDAIQSVWARSWWQRAWVIQEAAVAESTMIMCGDSAVHWNAVANTYQAIEQHFMSLEKLQIPNKDTLIAAMERLRRPELSMPVINVMQCVGRVAAFISRKERASLMTNLGFMRITSSTNERDKVYAAFGVSDPAETTDIDYNLPVRDVYTKIAQQSILTHRGYSILSFCKFPSQGNARLGLPTWVPDWADREPWHRDYVPFVQKGLVINTEDIKGAIYSAARGSKLESVRFEDGGFTLVVPGLLQDTLAFVSSTAVLDPVNSTSPGMRQPQAPRNSHQEHDRRSTQASDAIINNMQWLREWAALQPQETDDLDWQYWIRTHKWTFQPQGSISQFDKPTYILTGERLGEAYLRTLLADVSLFGDGLKEERLKYHGIEKVRERIPHLSFSMRLLGRRLAVSQYGLLALVPAEATEGDIIAIAEGADIPFLLRSVGQGKLQFIGLCYVHGIMDGSVWHGYEGTGTSTIYELKIV